MAELMHPQLKRRIFMFYFAAGINLVMAIWVMSAGSGHASAGVLTMISLMFLFFAFVNFYFAKHLRKKWEAHVRERAAAAAAGDRV